MSDPDATNAVQDPIELGSTWRLGPGDRLRDWTLGELIGQGGSSVVFGATRVDGDFIQHAAVKLLRTVLADDGFHARFDRERRILLGLKHPHIVRLLDGGRSPDGVPWYAMERIDGVPLTAWAEGRPLRARLQVVVAVARAVDVAHQRLVVHCDLKPDNVLVDAHGEPHVLDFGIARLVDENERTGTLRMATPRWAAPEQLEGAELTTATDVYALGLLLWSVLCGEAPRGEVTTGKAMLAAAQRPLPAPSTREPAARGDLDAIVLRATAVDPTDRYRSAGALADDLERHLRGEAVHAREGVAWYRASRWARRNKPVVAGITVAVVLLVAWAGTASVQAQRIRVERDRAEATLDLMVGMLEAADPANARGEEITVSEVLERGLRELDAPGVDPEVAGDVRLVAGRVQYAVGAVQAARASLEEAHRVLAETRGPDDARTLRAALYLAFADFSDQADREGAVPRVLSTTGRLERVGAAEDAATGHMLAAEMLVEQGELARARAEIRAARRGLQEVGASRRAARALAIEGYIDVVDGDVEGGHARMRQALDETVAAVGTRVHPDVADIVHELAMTTLPPDLALHEESVALRRQLFGEGFAVAAALCNLGLALDLLEERERAVEVLEEALAMGAAARGQNHPTILRIASNLGAVLMDAGREEEALPILRRVASRPETPAHLRERAAQRVATLEARIRPTAPAP